MKIKPIFLFQIGSSVIFLVHKAAFVLTLPMMALSFWASLAGVLPTALAIGLAVRSLLTNVVDQSLHPVERWAPRSRMWVLIAIPALSVRGDMRSHGSLLYQRTS